MKTNIATDIDTAASEARHKATQELASKLWDLAGRPSDSDLTFWLQAERQVLLTENATDVNPATEERSRDASASRKSRGKRPGTTAATPPLTMALARVS